MLIFSTGLVARAATQVGSAPYKASSTGAGNSYAPVFSADGKHVAFVSHANNLVTNDNLAPHLDLFLRDLVSSNTVLVSVSTNGIGGGNDNIGLYTLSSNAQVIAFDTAANNLAPGDTNRVSDIYVRDLVAGITRLLTPGANGPSSNPLISEDGQRVIFESLASNLVTNDFNGTNDIFIHDLTTSVTELVTVNADGTASPDGPSHSPSISADGLTVAFVSHATNLSDGVTNRFGEIYVRDIAGRSNLWAQAAHLSATHSGSLNPYRASEPVLSANGRYVAFKTEGQTVRFDLLRPTNTVFLLFINGSPPQRYFTSHRFDDNPRLAISSSDSALAFTRDGRYAAYETKSNSAPSSGIIYVDFDSLVTNEFCELIQGCIGCPRCDYGTNITASARIVSTNSNPSSAQATLSWIGMRDDLGGIFVVADAGNLVGSVTNRSSQLYSLDIAVGTIVLLSTNATGLPGPDLGNVQPSISQHASLIAWDSPDDNLVLDDLNRAWDVFARNVDTGETQVISAPHPALSPATGTAMSKIAGKQSISGDGGQIVVLTRDSSLVPKDTNRLADAVIRDLPANTNQLVSGAFLGPMAPASLFIGLLEANNEVISASLSADGRYAIFTGGRSQAGFSGTLTNAFWRDLQLDTNDFVADFMMGSEPALSSEGRIVAVEKRFYPNSGQLLIFLRDLRSLPGVTRLMSRRRGGVDVPPDGVSLNPVFSPDSRWLVFQSLATDLTYDPGPVMGFQLYAREIDTPFIKRISYSGSEGTNVFPLAGGATNPVFSADARFVFFEGSTSNLIYRHDLLNDMDDSGAARRPNLIVCSGCANASASSEGRYVAYESRPGLTGGTNVYVKDLVGGQEELISISLTGTGGNGSSFTPLLSHDARFVVFASKASDLVPGDNNRATDIFVRDRLAGVTHCLSRNFSGTGTGNRVSSNPILSADGRTVAFQSFASDLVPGDYNDTRDVFVVTLGGPDTDDDGMEDDWEIGYFSTLERDGAGDFDRDGASDLDEFLAGTNPGNDASILRVLTLTTRVAAGPNETRSTVVIWSAIPGRTYRVQFKSDLNSPWSVVGEDMIASSTSGSVADVQEAGGATIDSPRFYRVLLVR